MYVYDVRTIACTPTHTQTLLVCNAKQQTPKKKAHIVQCPMSIHSLPAFKYYSAYCLCPLAPNVMHAFIFFYLASASQFTWTINKYYKIHWSFFSRVQCAHSFFFFRGIIYFVALFHCVLLPLLPLLDLFFFLVFYSSELGYCNWSKNAQFRYDFHFSIQ